MLLHAVNVRCFCCSSVWSPFRSLLSFAHLRMRQTYAHICLFYARWFWLTYCTFRRAHVRLMPSIFSWHLPMEYKRNLLRYLPCILRSRTAKNRSNSCALNRLDLLLSRITHRSILNILNYIMIPGSRTHIFDSIHYVHRWLSFKLPLHQVFQQIQSALFFIVRAVTKNWMRGVAFKGTFHIDRPTELILPLYFFFLDSPLISVRIDTHTLKVKLCLFRFLRDSSNRFSGFNLCSAPYTHLLNLLLQNLLIKHEIIKSWIIKLNWMLRVEPRQLSLLFAMRSIWQISSNQWN